jgi:hyperosmotically inducible periplasmic protein
MKKAALSLAIAIGVLGGAVGPAQSVESTHSPSAQTAPDNTGRNVRDRSGKTLTPGDQSENKVDRELTRHIRRAVVKDKALSTTAKNIKIITTNGVVTLRGPVKSEGEKEAIMAKAQQIAGDKQVNNQLEVKGH